MFKATIAHFASAVLIIRSLKEQSQKSLRPTNYTTLMLWVGPREGKLVEW